MNTSSLFLIFLQLASGLRVRVPKANAGPLYYSIPTEGLELSKGQGENPKKSLAAIIGNAQFGKGCKNEKAPRVAVCLAGLSRRFVASEHVAYLIEKLLMPMKESGASGLIDGSSPDVFVHTKLGGYPEVATDREMSAHHVSNTKANVLTAAKEIGAVAVVAEDGWGAITSRSQLGNPSCFHPHGAVEGVMSYFYSMHGCLEQIQTREKETGKMYEFVVQSRPDTVEIETNANHIKNSLQCEQSFFLRDSMAYATRAAFESYANTLKTQFENPKPSLCGMSQSNEYFTKMAAKEINDHVGKCSYIR